MYYDLYQIVYLSRNFTDSALNVLANKNDPVEIIGYLYSGYLGKLNNGKIYHFNKNDMWSTKLY